MENNSDLSFKGFIEYISKEANFIDINGVTQENILSG